MPLLLVSDNLLPPLEWGCKWFFRTPVKASVSYSLGFCQIYVPPPFPHPIPTTTTPLGSFKTTLGFRESMLNWPRHFDASL